MWCISGRMSDNVVDLGNHLPTVDSVIERLGRHRDRIASITAVITWDDGSMDICHDTKNLEEMAYEQLLLNRYLHSLIEDRSEPTVDGI